jgi:hypothetical protein
MSFIIDVDQINYTTGAYTNAWGTQCVALVQLATPAADSQNPPETTLWRKGYHIRSAPPGIFKRGTVIATFTPAGTYPTGTEGNRHAAIYLSHDSKGIKVIDQWHPGKPIPGQRTLEFTTDKFWWEAPRQVNKGDHFYVVEVDLDF